MFIFLLTWVALNVLGHCNCGFRYGVLYFLNQLIYIYIYISILILFILWNRRIICVNQLYQEEHKSICMYGKVIVTIIILFGRHQIFRT